MKPTLITLALLAAVTVSSRGQRRGPKSIAPEAAQYPPLPKDAAEKRILATIDSAVKANELYANVPAADGKMLRLLAEAVDAKRVVEIGTSTGISGLWFSMALRKTGGHLETFDIDEHRAALAHQHFTEAGVDGLITQTLGDAHQALKKLKGPIDVVFIDAEKPGYVDYFNTLFPLVRPGGLILAHNVEMVPDYMKVVTGNPDLATSVFMQGNGLAITLKKR